MNLRSETRSEATSNAHGEAYLRRFAPHGSLVYLLPLVFLRSTNAFCFTFPPSPSIIGSKSKSKPTQINNEDDILHLSPQELPSFGNVLRPSDSERLIQFLTVPYLRIPLILDFFANGDPNRITALKCHSLQCIIDAALFEPGKWRPQDDFTTVSAIPVVNPIEYEKVSERSEHNNKMQTRNRGIVKLMAFLSRCRLCRRLAGSFSTR